MVKKSIFATEEYKEANAIALVLSFNHEVDTFSIIEQALMDHKRIFVPKMDYLNHQMTFKRYLISKILMSIIRDLLSNFKR